jgi:hypothetical protein
MGARNAIARANVRDQSRNARIGCIRHARKQYGNV